MAQFGEMRSGSYGIGGLRVEVVNFENVIAGIAQLGTAVINAAEAAVAKEALYELGLTKHQVPWRTGELWHSGRVEGPDFDAETVTVDIAYGGPAGSGEGQTMDVDYAVIVHEDLEAHHLFGRKAKYVEDPVRAEWESGKALRRMMNTIEQELATGVSYGAFGSKGGSYIRGAGGKFQGSTQA